MVKSALATMFLGTYATNGQEFIGYSLCSTQTSKIIKSGLIPRALVAHVSGHTSQKQSRVDSLPVPWATYYKNDEDGIGCSCFWKRISRMVASEWATAVVMFVGTFSPN